MTPVIIAGPCSVENQSQLYSTVGFLSSMAWVSMIRCGVWKPRTQPGGFEGNGEDALKWIDNLRPDYPGLKFCCEVANAHHVEVALNHGINAVWIGARTTASPFAVQEITEALRGADIPVLVKNAPMPDLHIWIGAMERCRQVGITQITAVHRGFDIYNNFGYRNNPLWELPMELHRQMPDMPLLCDPSHICGKRDLIASVSQTALDLHFDGLMVEVHPSPDMALTDARQQLSHKDFAQLIANLVVRTGETPNDLADLRAIRCRIDDIDNQLLTLLSERQNASCRIAEIKQRENMTVFQPSRWREVLQNRISVAAELGLDTAFVKDLFEKIHAESVYQQEKMLSCQNPKNDSTATA